MASYEVHCGPFRFRISATWSERVRGITSKLEDGNHVLFWDFDSATEEEVVAALSAVQAVFYLGDVYLFSSGKAGHYHAYCFTPMDWETALYAVHCTKFIDVQWWKLCAIRGYFTLRVSPKNKREVHYIGRLIGDNKAPIVLPVDLIFHVNYWTNVLNHQ